jgi:outer membrane protein
MNRWLSFVIVLLVLLPPVASAQSDSALTIDDAVRLGKEQSHLLKASQAKAVGAEARAREARTAFFPTLKVDAAYRRLSDVPPFAVSLPFPGFTPIVISPMIADNYQLHAGIQQPIFTGFRLQSNAKAASLQAEAGQADVRNDEADLVVNIISSYWMLYQARAVKAAYDENVLRLERYERDTKNLVAAGLATRNDLLRIQVQLQNARLAQIDGENDEEVARMNLNIVIGRDADAPVLLASAPRAEDLGGLSAGTVDGALAARPDVAAMEARVAAARASVAAAQGGYFPQLVLSANYYYSKPNQRYFPATNRWNDTWDVGVQMQFDVWNWGATGDQTEQARAALQANEELLAQMKQSVSLDVERSKFSAARAREKVAVARLGVSQAEENAKMIADKYHAGLATSTELLDANVALVQAKTAESAAEVEQEIADVRLAKSLGQVR